MLKYTVYITFKDGVQNQLYAMNYNFPVSMSLNLKINSFGKIELSKLNTQGDLVNGAIFEVKGPDNYSQEVTVTGGKIILDKLKKGTYTVKEKSAPEGYLLKSLSKLYKALNNSPVSVTGVVEYPHTE